MEALIGHFSGQNKLIKAVCYWSHEKVFSGVKACVVPYGFKVSRSSKGSPARRIFRSLALKSSVSLIFSMKDTLPTAMLCVHLTSLLLSSAFTGDQLNRIRDAIKDSFVKYKQVNMVWGDHIIQHTQTTVPFFCLVQPFNPSTAIFC